ncbi:nitrophenyl compound nitroreductase subunit ArsF family protein [uncultured Parabacteroides sp.]|uniref:nitrophenyl compound nitroreductase subunit ArsF family protein n=1 Tax=uncultured Parabacteroides sp. TaxID=512312 RepID=UPI00262D8F08|nr:nitrophenyl compound nitroreductase subunit ArsF family protein [uncultured Parabacteroides sp.]
MKTLRVLSLIMLAMIFVNNGIRANENANEVQVEVIVFHGVKQCQTCQAIKKNSQDVVENLFKEPGKGKKVVYKVIDFSKPENKEIARKYEIAWTSLVLVKHTPDGKEVVNNLSKFAIENARTNTDAFKKRLAEDITKLLN